MGYLINKTIARKKIVVGTFDGKYCWKDFLQKAGFKKKMTHILKEMYLQDIEKVAIRYMSFVSNQNQATKKIWFCCKNR